MGTRTDTVELWIQRQQSTLIELVSWLNRSGEWEAAHVGQGVLLSLDAFEGKLAELGLFEEEVVVEHFKGAVEDPSG